VVDVDVVVVVVVVDKKDVGIEEEMMEKEERNK
jgi:hypothetical protein